MAEKKELPLHIDNEIFIRSVDQKTLKARSKILGARRGDFILIEEPIAILSDRLSSKIEGELICTFFFDGDLYRFQSKTRRDIGDGLTLIQFPQRFQVEQVRQFHRIQVNLETRIQLEGATEVHAATMLDISQGGCALNVHTILPAPLNILCRIDFILPDNSAVQGVEAKVRSINFHKLKKITEMGIQFLGPPAQIAKIASFCQFCMFFKA